MTKGGSALYKGLYFVFIAVVLALIFYIGFGVLSGYEQPFFNLTLLPVFMASNVILSIIVYAVSVRDVPEDNGAALAAGMRRPVIILVCALALSAVFPAISLIGLYPVYMAVFHLIILFYAGISLCAVIIADVIFLRRAGTALTGYNRYIFPVAVLISLGISYMTLHVFRLLTFS